METQAQDKEKECQSCGCPQGSSCQVVVDDLVVECFCNCHPDGADTEAVEL